MNKRELQRRLSKLKKQYHAVCDLTTEFGYREEDVKNRDGKKIATRILGHNPIGRKLDRAARALSSAIDEINRELNLPEGS